MNPVKLQRAAINTVPIGEDRILNWMRDILDRGGHTVRSGDTLVEYDCEDDSFSVYRLTQRYTIDRQEEEE